jgi:hypothetical protein
MRVETIIPERFCPRSVPCHHSSSIFGIIHEKDRVRARLCVRKDTIYSAIQAQVEIQLRGPPLDCLPEAHRRILPTRSQALPFV